MRAGRKRAELAPPPDPKGDGGVALNWGSARRWFRAKAVGVHPFDAEPRLFFGSGAGSHLSFSVVSRAAGRADAAQMHEE